MAQNEEGHTSLGIGLEIDILVEKLWFVPDFTKQKKDLPIIIPDTRFSFYESGKGKFSFHIFNTLTT